MKSRTIRGKSPEEVGSALIAACQDGFRPTLAISFSSIKQDIGALSRIISDRGIAIFGITTNGEFTENGVSAGEIAILLLDMPQDCFHVFLEEFENSKFRDVAKSIATRAGEKFGHPAFLVGISNLKTNAEEILQGFEDIFGKDVNVTGALGGDDLKFQESIVFTNGKISNSGIVALAINEEKIKVRGRAIFGWNPVGTAKTVTKSEGNHLFTVENTPVLDLLMKYGGLENVTPENFALEHAIALTFLLFREKGEPIARAGLMVDWNDHSMYCTGPIPQGSKVKFLLPPDFDAIENAVRGCEELKATEMPEADALILFSCAGRLLAFGPLISEEIDGVRKVWNKPIAGMFSNAELARATAGNLELHGFTACTVALKEI